jgi:hypothetical protein
MTVRALAMAACLLAGTLAGPATAATVHRLFGDSNGDFTLPASPTPDSYTEAYFGIAGKPGRLDGVDGIYSFYFYTLASGGGFDMTDDNDPDRLIQLAGPVLFGGPTTAPRFIAGVYTLTDLDGGGDFTLTITAVPEPANWALLITGFGLTGAALRRRHLAVI